MSLENAAFTRVRSITEVKFVVIESRLLEGERIVLVLRPTAIKSVKEKYPDLVMYYTTEIKELHQYKDDRALIKQAHKIKKMFGGYITAETLIQRRKQLHDHREGKQIPLECIGG